MIAKKGDPNVRDLKTFLTVVVAAGENPRSWRTVSQASFFSPSDGITNGVTLLYREYERF